MSGESRCRGCGGELVPGAWRALPELLVFGRGWMRPSLRRGKTGSVAAPDMGRSRRVCSPRSTETCGSVPQTLLRDTDPGPLVLPGSPEMPAPARPPRAAPTLRRDRPRRHGRRAQGPRPRPRPRPGGQGPARAHRDKPELIRRFLEEAQIGGQLQHPGIVPVYELGAFADGRPYFAMKLVKGRTLAELLAESQDARPTDLPRFLSIFEQVCQTMAYAHARGVIHRDLKPSNVMVGAFGEVQVMDWGLAKVLPRAARPTTPRPASTRDQETVIATARSGSDADLLAGRHGAWARPPTWPPSRPAARSTGSTSVPTSSPWARSSARSSPASPPSPADRRRDPAQGRRAAT